MGHIFISYSHRDKDYVHKLQKALQKEGFDVWIDDRIDYGTEWPKVIQQHLDECDAFVVVVSENAYESKWVQNELARAGRKKKPFFPLLLQGDPWLSVEATQYVDVTGGSLPDEKFYQRLALVVSGNKIKKDELNVKTEPSVVSRWFGIGGIIFVSLLFVLFGGNYILNNLPTTATPTVTKTYTSSPSTLTPISTLEIGSTMISEKDGMVLVYVPTGTFTMGNKAQDALTECQKFRSDCQLDWFNDEEPPHEINLSAYWIDQTEVTNIMYAKCVADNGACKEPINVSSSTHSSYYNNFEFNNYPVIWVDWNMANTYCSWANRRLPTEAEWEKAARGPDISIYPFGSNGPYSGLLNYNSYVGDTTKVGNYPDGKSFYGAYDMAGNVWEWVNDWYDVYPGGNAGASSDFGQKYRVLRGGSWLSAENDLRSASRGWSNSAFDNYIGFRCARSP